MKTKRREYNANARSQNLVMFIITHQFEMEALKVYLLSGENCIPVANATLAQFSNLIGRCVFSFFIHILALYAENRSLTNSRKSTRESAA